jgi:hypothetical protein
MAAYSQVVLNERHRVRAAEIRIPAIGAWEADVVTDDAIALGELEAGCTLALDGLTLTGHIYRAIAWQGTTRARIVGGAGGWSTELTARFYRMPAGIPRALLFSDAAAEVGERFDANGDATKVGTLYARLPGRASSLFYRFSLDWHVRPDGVTTIAPWSTAPITSQFDPMGYDAARGVVTVATETFADWTPGRTFSSTRLPPYTFTANSLVHHIGAGKVRTEVWVGSLAT